MQVRAQLSPHHGRAEHLPLPSTSRGLCTKDAEARVRPALPVGHISPYSEIPSSTSEKHKSLGASPKSAVSCPRSVPLRGRITIATDVGNGMRWTRAGRSGVLFRALEPALEARCDRPALEMGVACPAESP